jgi:hypothetical protein
MNEEDLQKIVDIYVGVARDVRLLRDMVMVALVVLVVGALFAVVIYQRRAIAAAAAAVKG